MHSGPIVDNIEVLPRVTTRVTGVHPSQLSTQFDVIAIRNDRLANRAALHLAPGGGFVPPAP
jgi:hypothetical protein